MLHPLSNILLIEAVQFLLAVPSSMAGGARLLRKLRKMGDRITDVEITRLIAIIANTVLNANLIFDPESLLLVYVSSRHHAQGNLLNNGNWGPYEPKRVSGRISDLLSRVIDAHAIAQYAGLHGHITTLAEVLLFLVLGLGRCTDEMINQMWKHISEITLVFVAGKKASDRQDLINTDFANLDKNLQQLDQIIIDLTDALVQLIESADSSP